MLLGHELTFAASALDAQEEGLVEPACGDRGIVAAALAAIRSWLLLTEQVIRLVVQPG